jgi:hypothetical protein
MLGLPAETILTVLGAVIFFAIILFLWGLYFRGVA